MAAVYAGMGGSDKGFGIGIGQEGAVTRFVRGFALAPDADGADDEAAGGIWLEATGQQFLVEQFALVLYRYAGGLAILQRGVIKINGAVGI